MALKIVDSHFHFYDKKINHYPILTNYDEKLALLWGKNYQQKLPDSYLPADYFKDMNEFEIEGLVMAELVSTDPLKEMQFASNIANKNQQQAAAIANISLRDKNLVLLLKEYLQFPLIRSVRDHLLWDPNNSNRCYTDRPGILLKPIVQESFTILQEYPFNFEFEVYAHEIPVVLHYAKKFPSIKFALHCLGWPLDQSQTGFSKWKTDMQSLSQCNNVYVKITAIECIFGLEWSLTQITPWIKATVDIFSPTRCMFGSHLPVTKCSKGAKALYEAYQSIVKDFSLQEQQFLFADTAKDFYNIR
ncbi:amidohydrolase family protein [Legionella longbeachae]|uniref:Putative amidohydrolase n=1 Tax=Legionella longbeachae serogroup 1 (strain NSW150) TaxID=661367 RepID=D3HJN8_LEGLN|nr:amidohydrolase family protein [Legionella longbeachae]VEE03166.1 amidohydrolase [Legionella oakridgensis]HBD7398968.1 amidohydrolase family protein [Legionella pneumophila]ARB93934.1 amidohydrolase [Legionella longbeachae]ARM32928.1 amidohydrolase family protein [Legionella longbeachae]EEZ94253.1 amidohydrolase family protein [Legionella longbeachae D-4968]